MTKNLKELEKDLEFCNEVMHDMEHKLEDAYIEENSKEVKRINLRWLSIWLLS